MKNKTKNIISNILVVLSSICFCLCPILALILGVEGLNKISGTIILFCWFFSTILLAWLNGTDLY